MPDSRRPIGIFDSGIGGLTVLREVARRLPGEDLLYLGDTARVPYGTKSAATVQRYAQACTRVLLEEHIKLLVVACNTASAYALDTLRATLPIPVIGVIEPGARAAARRTQNGCIGVIGTAGTISSEAYSRAIAGFQPGARVFTRACPLFVPLAEEGWVTGEIPEGIARAYLTQLLECGIDILVLGCTHYPLLRATIAAVAGEEVILVDSAEETARVVEETLDQMQLHADGPAPGAHRFLVTDDPARFNMAAEHFLGQQMHDVVWVDV